MNLFVAASSNHRELDLCLTGMAWSDLPIERGVIVVVDNTRCNRDTAKTLAVAERFASAHAPFDVYHSPVERSDLSLGAGLSMQRALLKYPSGLYAYVDDDMFPVTRDWLPRLMRTREEYGTDIALGMTNMTGMCVADFLGDIGSGLEVPTKSSVPWGGQMRTNLPFIAEVWRETLRLWPRVQKWNEKAREPQLRSRVRKPGVEKQHLWANSMVFAHEWFERRAHDDWHIRGETEMQLQIVKPGDTDNAVVDRDALLLHWGYTPARRAMNALWPEVERKLKEHWCA